MGEEGIQLQVVWRPRAVYSHSRATLQLLGTYTACMRLTVVVGAPPSDAPSVVCGSGSDQQVRVAGTSAPLPPEASGMCGGLCSVGGMVGHTSAPPGRSSMNRRERVQRYDSQLGLVTVVYKYRCRSYIYIYI